MVLDVVPDSEEEDVPLPLENVNPLGARGPETSDYILRTLRTLVK